MDNMEEIQSLFEKEQSLKGKKDAESNKQREGYLKEIATLRDNLKGNKKTYGCEKKRTEDIMGLIFGKLKLPSALTSHAAENARQRHQNLSRYIANIDDPKAQKLFRKKLEKLSEESEKLSNDSKDGSKR